MTDRAKPLTIPGSIQPGARALESDIIRLRRRGRLFEEETTENITNVNTSITDINADLDGIQDQIDDLENIYVKSVPIREIVVLERADWEDITTPDPTILYCVYDEA